MKTWYAGRATHIHVEVFSDGVTGELATLSGDTANGYTATFQLGI